MSIPTTLSARRIELEREIERHQTKAEEFNASARSETYCASLLLARLEELDVAIAAYDAAWLENELLVVLPSAEPAKRERRDLRKLVLEFIERYSGTDPVDTAGVCGHFELSPSRATAIIGYLRTQGKITGDDTGWRLVRGEGELRLAAE